jgi:hypothetical protein
MQSFYRSLVICDPSVRDEFVAYLEHAKAAPQVGMDGETVWWNDPVNVQPLDAVFFADRPFPMRGGNVECWGCSHLGREHAAGFGACLADDCGCRGFVIGKPNALR